MGRTEVEMKFKYYLGLVAATVVGFVGGYALCAWNYDYYGDFDDDDDFDEECSCDAGGTTERHYTDLNTGAGSGTSAEGSDNNAAQQSGT